MVLTPRTGQRHPPLGGVRAGVRALSSPRGWVWAVSVPALRSRCASPLWGLSPPGFIFPPAFSLQLSPNTKPCASPGALALTSLFATF